MLLSFSISNFRSFREEQTLSMVASSNVEDHPGHLHPIPNSNEQLLSTALVYGANGSGKSNLVMALAFLKQLVLKGTAPDEKIQREPFLFGKSTPSEPTTVEVRFIRDGNTYSYGFKISDVFVQEEWLILLIEDREVILFERITTSDAKVEIRPGPGLEYGYDKVLALISLGGRTNQLFLSSVRETLAPSNFGALFNGVLEWFQSLLIISSKSSPWLKNPILESPSLTEFAGNFLRDSSTGISGLHIQTTELVGSLPASELYRRRIPLGHDTTIEEGDDSNVIVKTLRSEHELDDGSTITMPFSEESDGTRQLANLVPILYRLKTNRSVFVIDEIDRSLHPLLSKKFVEYFLNASAGTENQLIITTHESNLFDLDLLRKDELWFTEKDARGATSLYSLVDFKIRPDLKIDKGYLQGRFGAIPFLGKLDNLLLKQTEENP